MQKNVDLANQVQKNNKIIEDCRRSKSLFEDPEFPANDSSIKFSSGSEDQKTCKWLRPKEIEQSAELVVDGFSRFDVKQGGFLGNCWILAALAGVAERKDIMARILPDGQVMQGDDYCGAFRFRLRQFGKEIEVLVDDRLPTIDGDLAFSQPVGRKEFWVCLLEKAYAKIHGCYESLHYGSPVDALTDLAGGLCETMPTDEWKSRLPEMARYIDKCITKKCIVTALSTQDERDNGVEDSHAYTVTGVKLKVEHPKTGAVVDLIRLRNPWGHGEFKGDWSDNFKGWSDELKRLVQLDIVDNGEFWMSFDDFANNFSKTTIAHFAGLSNSAEKLPAGSQWRSQEFYGEWIRGRTSGGDPIQVSHFDNPQYVVDFTDSELDDDGMATCIVSLEVEDQRNRPVSQQKYIAMGICLYHLPEKEMDRVDGKTLVDSKKPRPIAASFMKDRTLTHRFYEKPGRYAVMACSYEPVDEAKFFLRIFTEI